MAAIGNGAEHARWLRARREASVSWHSLPLDPLLDPLSCVVCLQEVFDVLAVVGWVNHDLPSPPPEHTRGRQRARGVSTPERQPTSTARALRTRAPEPSSEGREACARRPKDSSLLLGANAGQVVLDQHVGGGHDGDARQGPAGRGDTEHEHPHDHKWAVNEQKSTEIAK